MLISCDFYLALGIFFGLFEIYVELRAKALVDVKRSKDIK